MAKRWRCFHCDEVFTMYSTARAHFGPNETHQPMCQIDPEEFRRMERELERYRDEDSDKDRQMHLMAADHRSALIREEEKGYERGMRDMRKLAMTWCDTYAYVCQEEQRKFADGTLTRDRLSAQEAAANHIRLSIEHGGEPRA